MSVTVSSTHFGLHRILNAFIDVRKYYIVLQFKSIITRHNGSVISFSNRTFLSFISKNTKFINLHHAVHTLTSNNTTIQWSAKVYTDGVANKINTQLNMVI